MAFRLRLDLFTALVLSFSPVLWAENASKPTAEPTLDPATMHSLGLYWIVQGDDNKNARIDVEYRKVSVDKPAAWLKGPPLFRVEKGAHKNEKGKSALNVPPEAWLFAGSVLMLEPGTEYELHLVLIDPDGGNVEKTLSAKTASEPAVPEKLTTFHIAPGEGGGTGSAQDPFKGLNAALGVAKPGTLFLVHTGTYPGTFEENKSGEPGNPIIFRGAGDGEVILDAKDKEGKNAERTVTATDIHDVWFENLSMRNGTYVIVLHRSQRIVIRRCHISGCDYGIMCSNNTKGNVAGFFIADNVIESYKTWPKPDDDKDYTEGYGIKLTGTGHEVCYNRIRGFADGMDTCPSEHCYAIDFHHNEISEMQDDGCEMDGSERNTRCFMNRFTNVFQGISVQPIFGGPVYIIRNVLYNVDHEPFKMHNSPSGALMLHNTVAKARFALCLWTGEKVRNCIYRNNLFLGTEADYMYENSAPMLDCDFDYDGFSMTKMRDCLKWNKVVYKTFEDLKANAPVEKHAVWLDGANVFASGLKPPGDYTKQFDPATIDLRLKEGCAAIDAGEPLPGINAGFAGKAPDLGAYEFGQELPHYGPRK